MACSSSGSAIDPSGHYDGGNPTQRLNDVVYWRTYAVPGEQMGTRNYLYLLLFAPALRAEQA